MVKPEQPTIRIPGAIADLVAVVNQGFHDALDGQDTNPHPAGTREHHAWKYGFQEGLDYGQ